MHKIIAYRKTELGANTQKLDQEHIQFLKDGNLIKNSTVLHIEWLYMLMLQNCIQTATNVAVYLEKDLEITCGS